MQRRPTTAALILTVVSVLVALAPVGRQARAQNAVKKPAIPIHALVTAPAVYRNDEERVQFHSILGTHILMRVLYASGGFKKKGKVDEDGNWEHIWTVRAGAPGPATVALFVTHGHDSRNYSLHFTVLPDPTSTPTSTPTATATATSTSTVAPTPTSTPVSAPSPTATPITTGTRTPTSTPGASLVASLTATSTSTLVSTGGATDTPVPTDTPEPTFDAGPTDTPVPAGPITLDTVSLYQVMDDGSLGDPTTSFPHTAAMIYAEADFSDWQGEHTITFNWYGPTGELYYATTDDEIYGGDPSSPSPAQSGSFVTTDNDGDGVADDGLSGNWRLDVIIDDQQPHSYSFTIASS